MPAGRGVKTRSRWTDRRDSAIGWVVALGLVAAILLVPALCIMGIVIDNTGARADHPILRRLGEGTGALVIAAVCFLFGFACFAGFRRVWRLQLHGRTNRGTVLQRYSTPGYDDLSGTERAIMRVDLVTVDVALLDRRRPQVGDEIRIRYDPKDPASAVHAHWSVTGIFTTVVVEAIVIVFGGGSIILGLVMLYAFVDLMR
jgi:hypothetical protein